MASSAAQSRGRKPPAQLPLEWAASPVQAGELPFIDVRRHPRARRLSVRVDPAGQVVVVAPRRTSAATVQRFIAEHRHWIVRTWQKLAPVEPVCLPEVIVLPALARRFDVRFCGAHSNARRGWRQHGGVIEVMSDPQDRRCGMDLLRGWLLGQARGVGPALVAEVGAETGLRPQRLQFRLQRTRWGSCSSRGTVSLNACMLFLDAPLLRYLLVHELCHLRHMDHSPRYWALVARFAPRYRELERALDAAWQRVPGWVFG